jgi:hypothetical protein
MMTPLDRAGRNVTTMGIITLTKQHPTNSPVLHPAEVDVGAPIITESMLAAGEHVLVDEIGICGADIARDIACAVFKAMSAAKVP